MNLRDTIERLFWTVLAAFLGALAAGPVLSLDLTAIEAAGVAALGAGINFVLLIARTRLAALPDPGAGLPGLPVEG